LKDKDTLFKIINSIYLFSEDEKTVAKELIEEVYENETDGKVHGYHCTGKRSMTEGVYDMYWIAVDPNYHNKGVGKLLINHAEKFVKDQNGNLILAETSSKDSYINTRAFYKANNYEVLAEIKDFYKKDDNLIIFGKYIRI
jgi:aminoglycoside 6'-N-acetyltransferase I